jgi:uncharacterized protein (UPF0276 family)
MYLAINYSPPAALLVLSGQINIDYFKTPDWEWMVSEAKILRPVAVHFSLESGNNDLRQVDWSDIEHLARITDTPYFNLHLDSMQRNFNWLSVDSTSKSDIEQVFEVLLSDVMIMVERFGSERIIVENSPYRGEVDNTLRLCVEPDLITRVVEETGCGLLLDISHAIITAAHIGMNPYEYLSRLPIHKVKEMHFAGIHHIKGRWIDHLSILKRDWHWLDWVLARILSGDCSTPWLLAFEYGGVGAEFKYRCDPKVIIEQIPLLYERVQTFNLKTT